MAEDDYLIPQSILHQDPRHTAGISDEPVTEFPYDLSDSSDDDHFDYSDAQRHWDESVKQLEHAVFFVLCPVIGRLIGRRVAHRMWRHFVDYRWNLYMSKQPDYIS